MYEISSLVSALRFLPDHVRPEVIVLGIEPEKIDYGLDLSPALLSMMPRYIEVARALTAKWKRSLKTENSPQFTEVLAYYPKRELL